MLQSGMGLIAGPDLVGEVSNAGALGIVAGFMLSADQFRAAIREVRAPTDRPFGVNLWLAIREARAVLQERLPRELSLGGKTG